MKLQRATPFSYIRWRCLQFPQGEGGGGGGCRYSHIMSRVLGFRPTVRQHTGSAGSGCCVYSWEISIAANLLNSYQIVEHVVPHFSRCPFFSFFFCCVTVQSSTLWCVWKIRWRWGEMAPSGQNPISCLDWRWRGAKILPRLYDLEEEKLAKVQSTYVWRAYWMIMLLHITNITY